MSLIYKGPFAGRHKVLLVRHGKDEEELTVDLNQPLERSGLKDIKLLARGLGNWFDKLQKTGSCDDVIIHYGPSKRTEETANILFEEANILKSNISLQKSFSAREFYQGRFLIENHKRGFPYPPLEYAWRIFIKEVESGNIFYNFGDPKVGKDGVVEYPYLLRYFSYYGESQIDFSTRINLFLMELVDKDPRTAHIIVTHQVVCSRVQRLLSILLDPKKIRNIKIGQLSGYLRNQTDRITQGHGEGVALSFSFTQQIRNVLSREIEFAKNTNP